MQRDNVEYMIHTGVAHAGDRMADCVAKATEAGIVVPSILRKELEAAGFRINEDAEDHTANHGFKELKHHSRCLIHNEEDEIVAMGMSENATEALTHAVLGYLRERDIALFGFTLPLEIHRVTDASEIKGLKTADGVMKPKAVVAAVREHIAAKLERQAG